MDNIKDLNLEEAHNQEELLAVMVEIARETSEILSLDELLEKIAELAKQFVDYQIFAILLVDDTNQDLYFRFTIGYPESVKGIHIKFGDGLVGAAAAAREAILVADVSKDPRYIRAVEEVKSELAIARISRNRVIGVLDIESPQPNYFLPYHQKVLTLLASQLAVAIDNVNLYESLIVKSEMLETLHEIGKELSSILDLEQLLKRVAELLRRVFHYHMFSIFLVDEADQTLQAHLSVRYNRDAVEKTKIPLGKGLVGNAVAQKRSLLINDVSKDRRYINAISETKSEIVVPLIYKDKAIGVFDLQSPLLNDFTPFHEQALMTLASHVAVAIENAKLYERVVAAEARLDRELKIARDIQYSLIPDKFPEISGITFWAEFRPARILGGDIYDFFMYENDRVAIAIGDVSGKGAAAALYGALVSGILRTCATQKYPPAEMLRLVNLSLRQRAIEGRFMTLCYAVYDVKTRILKFSNSGAPAPLLCRKGQVEILSAEGFPLGMFDKAVYQEREIGITPGDTLVFYTDGLGEARDLQGEEFGSERLKQIVEKNFQRAAKELTKEIFEQVDRFSSESGKFDDQTVLVLRANLV
jgi:sigma-B regulation protein RsbU (phosphoserine phosphatase)